MIKTSKKPTLPLPVTAPLQQAQEHNSGETTTSRLSQKTPAILAAGTWGVSLHGPPLRHDGPPRDRERVDRGRAPSRSVGSSWPRRLLCTRRIE